MALYVYQGFWQDNLVFGGTGRVWPSAGSSGTFSIALVLDNANLDTTSGLNAVGATTWGALDSQAAVDEFPAGATYSRKDLPVNARTWAWDPGPPSELELKYNNVTNPITWANLVAGQTVGAYVLLRTVDGGSGDIVWMADTGATGLPATTNGEDLTITINTEGILKGWQPAQP